MTTLPKPELVVRPFLTHVGGMFGPMRDTAHVADFTAGVRPAFRVKARCRNCQAELEARFTEGTVVPVSVGCPMCGAEHLDAHVGFLARDTDSIDEEQAKVRAGIEEGARISREIQEDRERVYTEARDRLTKRKGVFR